MNTQEHEQQAEEARLLTQKLVDMLIDLNPHPRVAITALMVMATQVAMGMSLTKEQALDGLNETWGVVSNKERGVMQ